MDEKVRQLTKEQAITFAEVEAWKGWGPGQIASFQLRQRLMCMPFSVFHAAVEETLGRPVFTHEFVGDNLLRELQGLRKMPTPQEIIEMIPVEKRIIIGI